MGHKPGDLTLVANQAFLDHELTKLLNKFREVKWTSERPKVKLSRVPVKGIKHVTSVERKAKRKQERQNKKKGRK